ncbi:MAG: CheR family methyltransferase [Gemmatimonadaceae bacterium]
MIAAELPDEEFQALLDKISRDRGFRCASYKTTCLRRRVGVRMRARGLHRYLDYAGLLDTDATEYDLLLDALTINVTKLFRNPEVYRAILREVIPAVWDAGPSHMRIWSAGCASGEEPYSLAALFHLYAAERGQLDRLHRVEVLGTDIDRRSLAAADRGEFEERDFSETPEAWRAAYFASAPPFTVVPELRRLVKFREHDLLREAPPQIGNDLIVCRNAIIYFDRASQEHLFETFYSALAPGGFLVLGKVETLFGRARQLFRSVDARERIFVRPT